MGFPGGSVAKNLPDNAEDMDSVPGPHSWTTTDSAMKGQQGALPPSLLPGRPPGFEIHAPY